jgi:hypothetical protein
VNKSGSWQEGIKAADLRLGSFVEVPWKVRIWRGQLGFPASIRSSCHYSLGT